MSNRTCRNPDCSNAFYSESLNRKYCSSECRKAPNGPTCAECGKRMHRGKGVLPQGQARCMKCKNGGRGYYEVEGRRLSHGQSGYHAGCRCEFCTEAQRLSMAAYSAKREAADGVIPSTASRRIARGLGPLDTSRKPVPCSVCGETMMSSLPEGKAAHKHCRPNGWFYVTKEFRLSIYERDEWTCQICFEPVDAKAHYLTDWYPTLDHILAQSAGGDESAENLRCCHRYCNLARRDRPLEDDYVVMGWAKDRRSLEVA